MNPLDRVGSEFALSLWCPNPKARRRKDGPRYFAEFEIDAETFDMLMSCRELAGMVIEAHCVVAAANEPIAKGGEATGPEPTEVGSTVTGVAHPSPREVSLASRLHIDGYFRNPKLWNALHNHGIYTAQEHKTNVERLPCLFALLRENWQQDPDSLIRALKIDVKPLLASVGAELACEGGICLHHVASATLPAAGQMQPENPRKVTHFHGVPLCAIGHHAGWVHAKYATREEKEMLREIAVALTAHNVKERVKTYLGRESMSGISQEELDRFEEELGLK